MDFFIWYLKLNVKGWEQSVYIGIWGVIKPFPVWRPNRRKSAIQNMVNRATEVLQLEICNVFGDIDCFWEDLQWRSNQQPQFPGRCSRKHHQLLLPTGLHGPRKPETGELFVVHLMPSLTSFLQVKLSEELKFMYPDPVKILTTESIL